MMVRFFDSFMDDEMLHIVMEYAPHGTLKTALQQVIICHFVIKLAIAACQSAKRKSRE